MADSDVSKGQEANAASSTPNGHADARLFRRQIAFVTAVATAVLMGSIALWFLRATYSQDRRMQTMRDFLDATWRRALVAEKRNDPAADKLTHSSTTSCECKIAKITKNTDSVACQQHYRLFSVFLILGPGEVHSGEYEDTGKKVELTFLRGFERVDSFFSLVSEFDVLVSIE